MAKQGFCVGCGRELMGRRKRFCSDTCREEAQQRKYEEILKAGELETQARDQLGTGQYSVRIWNVCRETNRSTSGAISKRVAIDRKLEESEDHG